MGRGRACGCCSGALSFWGGWKTPFVGVACTLWVRAEPWFAATNTTLVQGQGFEDYPQLNKGFTPGLLSLGSGSSRFVPAIAGVVHRLLFPLPAPHKPVGRFLGQGHGAAGLFSPFLPCSLCLQHCAVCFQFVCFAVCCYVLRG